MKFIPLPTDELRYLSTLDWNTMWAYVEKKYGLAYKTEMKKRLDKSIQRRIKEQKKVQEKMK